jgi:hypothetical protein
LNESLLKPEKNAGGISTYRTAERPDDIAGIIHTGGDKEGT